MRSRSLVVLVAAALLASAAAFATPPPCEHPYPCGDEWPSGLEGPFAFDVGSNLLSVDVPTHDGTRLHGWIALPQLPAGVRAPTIIQSTPYIGLCIAVDAVCITEPDDPAWWGDPESPSAEGNSIGVPPIQLVRMGYAVAYFSMRGTGRSEGCFQFFGSDDRRDQADLVNWVADQIWSNGRVGFGGGSYLATTTFLAAVENPPALKTIIAAGQLNDAYQHLHTPQGAKNEVHRAAYPVRTVNHSFGPYLGTGLFPGQVGDPDPDAASAWASMLAERGCSDTVDSLAVAFDRNLFDEGRQAAYWNERRPFADASHVTAAMLMVDGFKDFPDHQYQGDLTWEGSPNAPRKLIYGWFGHEYPPQAAPGKAWRDVLIPWLEYWLKGIGPTPSLGVDYQDEGTTDVPRQQPLGAWRNSADWPPVESQPEVLYLNSASSGSLGASADGTSRSYLSAHHPLELWQLSRTLEAEGEGVQFAPSLCQSDPLAQKSSLLYVTPPAATEVVLAGNPFAYLRVSSNLDGGLVHLALVELSPEFGCDGLGHPNQTFLKLWSSSGTADLRHYQGNYAPIPFPADTPTGVRVDLSALVRRIEAGHRLGLLVYGYELVNGRTAMPQGAEITLHGDGGVEASHLVLPIVQGSFGGFAPTMSYPPRPFLPS